VDQGRTAVVGADDRVAEFLSGMLVRAGFDAPQRSNAVRVAAIGAHAPDVLMIDFDHLRNDRLESLRQLRFVLPECTIVVLTSTLQVTWAKKCHLAGANGVLAAAGSEPELLEGLQHAMLTGCYTDTLVR
jgi:DNA-binding NarL/FixJ family response regulator